jgi:Polyketide cyclase / dehydrase and lipid transport
VPRVDVRAESTATPEQVLAAARDFSPRRAELWRDVDIEHLTIHGQGETWAEVTEGNPWPRPFGVVWERLRYDWSQPGALKATVIDSNLFKPGSTWEIRAFLPATGGGSRVEIVAVRDLKGRGWLLWPVFPLGLARRDVSTYLQQFLARVEAGQA